MRTAFPPRRRSQGGFTLIELMIAVAIIGILLRLAYPAYMNSTKKARRADAKTALVDLAQREERYMATTNQYTTSAPALGYSTTSTVTASSPMSVLSGSAAYYTLEVVTSGPSSFTATAKPTTAGGQNTDTLCGYFQLTEAGVQRIGGTGNVTDCW